MPFPVGATWRGAAVAPHSPENVPPLTASISEKEHNHDQANPGNRGHLPLVCSGSCTSPTDPATAAARDGNSTWREDRPRPQPDWLRAEPGVGRGPQIGRENGSPGPRLWSP